MALILSMAIRFMKLNRFIIYLAITLLMIIALLIRDFGVFKTVEFKSDFFKPTPYIAMLNPPDRVYYNTVVGSPVFFWTNLPTIYDTAEVHLDLLNPLNLPVQIGFASIPDQTTVPYYDGIILPVPKSTGVKFKLTFEGIDSSSAIRINSAKLIFHRQHYDLNGYLNIWKQNITKWF